MALIIALANQKGGVGKTTTCLNLGAGFAKRGFRTLLIDGDPQGLLSQYMGAEIPTEKEFSPLGNWVLERDTFVNVAVKTKWDNLSIIPSDERLIAAESAMSKDSLKSVHFLRLRIEELRPSFDVILIDTPPSFSLLFANALVASDHVIIPVKLEWMSVQGIQPLVAKINEVALAGKTINLLGVLATHRRHNNDNDLTLKELEEAFKDRVFNTNISINQKLAEAARAAAPIQFFDKNSQGAIDYEALTEEVVQRCHLKQPVAVQ